MLKVFTGRCYPQETLKEIMRFCESHKLHLISDEVYALSVFNQDDPNLPNFTSVLSFDPKDLIDINRLHVIYGFSKVSQAMPLGYLPIVDKSRILQLQAFD